MENSLSIKPRANSWDWLLQTYERVKVIVRQGGIKYGAVIVGDVRSDF
jgi:hypothetical protein